MHMLNIISTQLVLGAKKKRNPSEKKIIIINTTPDANTKKGLQYNSWKTIQ